MNYVYASSGAIILIFVFLILKKKKKSIADYLLIVINLIIGLFMVADTLVRWRLTSETVIFQNAIPLILFPVFVYYVLQFTHAKKRIVPFWYLMFLPFILFSILSITDHYILNNYPAQSDVQAHFNTPTIWYQLIFKCSQLTFIIIMIGLLQKLAQFDRELKKGFSTIDTIDVKWLRNFTAIYLGSICITFVLFLGQNLGLFPFEIKHVFGIIYGILVLSTFYLNYQGIQHYSIANINASNLDEVSPTSILANSNQLKQKITQLSEEEKILEQVMLLRIEQEQFYLEPKFSLDELADYLGKSKHLVSKIINSKENRSFYDLINGYRVEHLKSLLRDPKSANFTILSLGLDSGFNSKASMNRIFKNKTGITPKHYLNEESQHIE